MEIINILTLLNIRNIGPQTLKPIINSENLQKTSIKGLITLIKDLKKKKNKIKVPNDFELNIAQKKAEDILSISRANDVKIISMIDKEYPRRLLDVKDCPILLYVKGNINILNNYKSIAIVGTRKPTHYGKKYARAFAKELSKNGFVIVSGLALGCDTEAHEGCIEVEGKTIAILAQGMSNNEIMPRRNVYLAKKILEHDGCLLSEYPIGQIQSNTFYIQRNRIQSGLSEATVVIETNAEGGTMSTAKFCLKQNRLLACLKPPNEEKYASYFIGNKILIEENNAYIIENLSDTDNLINQINKKKWDYNQQLSF